MHLLEWFMPKKKEKVQQMPAKNKIRFSSTEKKVLQLPGSGIFSLKNPVERQIPSEGTVAIDLGVVCETHALDVFPAKGLADFGFEIVDGLGKKDVGEKIVVAVKNKNKRIAALPENEPVLRAFALDNSNLEIA